jgi:hypothetical protein
MNSEVDMCFVAEDFLPQDYLDGPHVKGAVHPEGIKDLRLMQRWMTGRHSCWKAVALRQVLPNPAGL